MWIDVDGMSIQSGKLFNKVSQGGMLTYTIKLDGIPLLAQASKSTENDLVIVVSNKLSEPNLLVLYSKRWHTECLFANLKSKGFNFEDTHFTAKDRIGNLTKLIALCMSYLPMKVKCKKLITVM